MKNSSTQIDRKILKNLEPLNRLNPILLDELAAKSIIDEVPAGRIICRHGDKDSRQIYLLSGQIEVALPGQTKTTIIKSKSALKTPIAETNPCSVTLKAKTASTLLYIDADLLELLMSDEPQLTTAYEVTEISADDSDDWMLTFLQSPAFLQLPTENIQKLLTHMEEIPAKKDQIVIKQGDKDDNYYIIKSGTCNVHRKPYENSASVLLAVLPTGSGFGEEALISNGTRNATITMRENGTLMRLKKDDFLTLLINPLITYYDYSETKKKVDEGCLVIDVRSEQQAKDKPVEGAVNIPLSMLRMEFNNLNAEREYLLVCNDGSQSAAAAFLMIQGGLLKCNVLKGGLNSTTSTKKVTKPVAAPIAKQSSASAKIKEQAILAKKQTEQLAAQQEQIKAARVKAEQDIAKHKKELAESRARIANKNQHHHSSKEAEAAQLKIKASQELAKAQAETKAIELRQKETTENILRAEKMMKQSEAAAVQTRKQAEKDAALIKQRAVKEAEQLRAEEKIKQAEQARVQAEKAAALVKQRAVDEAEQARKQAEKAAALIKQRAIDEAEQLRAEKASQELAKAQAEREAIELRQQETNKAMRHAEQMMKQSAAAAEQAEKEAALIKQRAVEEAEYLRAEVEASRQKMEQDATRLKEEEKLIKKSALKVKHEADEIRREALNDAKQVRSEIEETRALLSQKLQQTQEEEKRKHDAILTEAKKHADKLSATKTQQAETEAKAIRKKAKEDALRLHKELEQTRKQIEAEAAHTIEKLKKQSEQAIIPEQDIHIIEDEVLVELVAEENIDYKAVSIPGMSTIEPINDHDAQRKAEAIKAKLTQSQEAQQPSAKVKVHKSNDRTILEGNDDLFIFKEPESAAKVSTRMKQPAVSNRTRAETALTQIATEQAQKSVVIFPQQEQETANRNNPFLNQPESHTATSYNLPQFDKQAYLRKNQSSKSNTFAIAASFLMILAGAVFTLHATDTLKVQSVAALFNSGNDSVQTTAIAKTKTIRKKVLRADTKVNIKKKVGNKMDDIMQGWKNVLSEVENPKKSQSNK